MRTGQTGPYLSTVQAAEALGVSVSTVKRWVDEGVLPAHKTAGGHRKLLRAEVLALAREGNLPRGDLATWSVVDPHEGQTELEATAEALLQALLLGQRSEVRAVLRRAYDSGLSLETIADEVIAPSMARVGHEWETTRIDVWHEHRATQLCAAALYELKDELERRAEKNRPLALGGAPEGDPYLLPSLLAQLVLLDAGWEVVNLGPNTPLASLAKAVRELRPQLVWLSVSYLEAPSTFLAPYQHFYRVAERQDVPIVLGGQALVEPLRSRLPYTAYGDGMRQLAAFARTLHPRPRPPRPGRPRKP